jgi:hypothetical protein
MSNQFDASTNFRSFVPKNTRASSISWGTLFDDRIWQRLGVKCSIGIRNCLRQDDG